MADSLIHHPGTSCRQQNESGQCGCPWGQCAKRDGHTYQGGTKVYCCYGMYADVGHSDN